MMRYLPAAVLLAAVLTGCFGGGDEPVTTTPPSPPPTRTAVPESTPVPTATAVPTPVPVSVAFTWWAIDVRSGAISEAHPEAECLIRGDAAEVNAQLYADAQCGPISPDGRRMTYQVDAGIHPERGMPLWDQWVVDLETGERRPLQEGLVHCGGCDGRFFANWSPSGRYVYFAEWVQDGATFLSDMETEATRVLFEGNTDIGAEPRWSPVRDALLYRRVDGTPVYEDLVGGAEPVVLDAEWPMQFDATGTMAVTFAFAPRGGNPGGETSLLDLETGQPIATLSGVAAYPFFGGSGIHKATATSESFVAALDAPEGCDGTGVYRGPSTMICLTGAAGATVSPDGTQVAFARPTGTTSASLEGLPQPTPMIVYEIVVFSVMSGLEQPLAQDVLSSDVPPLIHWTGPETIEVRWPVFPGP